MADQRKTEEDAALDAAFAAMRVATPAPPEDLLARIAAEGAAMRPRAPQPAPARGGFGAFLAQIGGWPSLAGLAAASVAGLAIGISSPDLLGVSPFQSGADYELSDLMPGYGVELGEEG